MKKGIKFLLSFILILSIFSSMPAFANYNTVFQKSLSKNGQKLYADAYLMINLDNDTVIFEKNTDKKVAPASLTKIVTACVAIEHCKDINEVITCNRAPIRELDGTGSSVVGLLPGEKISIKDLLYILLVRSGNDAATVLADYVSNGDSKAYVKMMNDLVKKLGCKDTHFANVHGLDDKGNYTTANDLLKITKYALTLPNFEDICATKRYTVPPTNKSPERYLHNTNHLMNRAFDDYYSPYATGIKTGVSDDGGSVISKGVGNGYNYLAIILDSPIKNVDSDPLEENCSFIDCNTMFNWVFRNIELQSIANPDQVVAELPLELSITKDYIQLVPQEEVLALVPKGTSSGGILIEPITDSMAKSVKAPIEKGQVLGEARVVYAGSEIARIKLVASESVSRNPVLFILSILQDVFSSKTFKVLASIIVVAFVVYLTIWLSISYQRKKRKKLHIVRTGLTNSGRYTDKDKPKKK